MNATDHKHERYRIDDLVLDSGTVSLTRNGEDIPLPKLSFDLLLCLARNAPNVVTTDVLMHEVWGKVVVNEETVKQRVKLLRQSLGENSRAPRYFEAVRGRGYRMISKVSNARDDTRPGDRWRRTWRDSIWVLVPMAAAIALAAYWSRAPDGVNDSPETTVSQDIDDSLQEPPTESSEAYDLFLKGRAAYRRWTRQDNETALAFYQQAVEADPGFALAVAGVANSLALRATEFGMGREWAEEAVQTARQALELQPGLAEAHKALGICYFFEGHYQQALDHYREALKQKPDYDEALFNIAEISQLIGRWDEAVRYQLQDLQRPNGRDRLSIYLRNLGFHDEAEAIAGQLETELPVSYPSVANRSLHQLLAGDYRAARKSAARLQDLSPALQQGQIREGEVELLEGRLEQAETEFRSVAAVPGIMQDYARLRLAQLQQLKGDEEAAHALFRQVESNSLAAINGGHEGWFLRWNLAALHALEGNTEAALNWYERAVESGRRLYEWDMHEPAFESIRNEPRLQTALQRQRELRERMVQNTVALLEQHEPALNH